MPGTITVACKIPNGLVLRVFVNDKQTVNVLGGGVKDITLSRPTDWVQKLNGPARKLGQDVEHQIIHGAGLTHGVDADKFAIWLEQNRSSDVVVKGLVFGHVKPNDTIAQAHEHRNEKTGMEAVDPANMPPEFKRVIKTAEAA